ncbi:MAG: hypothetical protein A3K66_07900 [Euryarchaeota archaeon RBG_16_67_27]|nr:MAG: hypothetical protein A3K66_07900 [Euryarchaeota archaeon RBG_16_67_27]
MGVDRTRILAVSVVTLALVAWLPWAPGDPDAGQSDPSKVVVFQTDASIASLTAVGARVLEAYGAFAFAEAPASALAALAARGHRADPAPGLGTIRLLAGSREVGNLAREAHAPWALGPAGSAPGIVHFRVPAKPEWRDALEAAGLDVLRYIPENAFLVRGAPASFETARGVRHVDYVGPYEASWKIRPGLDAAAGTVDVRLVLLPGERPESVVAWLGHRGVPGRAGSGASVGVQGTFGSDDFRWVRARVPAGLIRPLADLPQIEFIDRVNPARLLNAEADWVLQTNRIVAGNSSLDLRYWWNGLDGRGQFVAISDTGLDYDQSAFRQGAAIVLGGGDIYNVTDPARRKVVRYHNMGVLTGDVAWPGSGTWDPWSIQDSDHRATGQDCVFGHGTAVASVLTGNDNWLGGGGGANDGLALGAKLVVQDIGTVGPDPASCGGDTDLLNYLPEDLGELLRIAYEDPLAPVRVHSNSWGSTVNEYDVQARAVDAFVWSHPDLAVFFATGNEGGAAATVNTPGTAKNVVTASGAGNPDGSDPFTGPNDLPVQNSRGPTSDGRLKPTLLTLFDGDSAMSDGSVASGGGLADDHWPGTSYATPAAAAAATIVRQYFSDGWYPSGAPNPANGRPPSAALVRAVLIASAVQITGGQASRSGQDVWPNHEQGFGRVVLSNALRIASFGEPVRPQVHEEVAGILTGDARTYRFSVLSAAVPLKFVLVWSDYPGTLAASLALVNDLNLEVTAPDGTVYLGNVFGTFADGQSIAGGAFDTVNVEEAVIRKTPAVGTWTVRVIGANVPVGPQPFALVAVGDLDGGYGRVAVDRPVYGAADAIRIEVEDAGAASVQVRVNSTFEDSGELISLSAIGGGVWSASLPTSLGPVSVDGVLQVRDGDLVTVSYADAAPAHTATATARVDAVGPTVSDVVADRPGTTSVRLRWRTDEAADSEVRYGTSPAALTSTASEPELRTDHALILTGLQPDTLYYFDVASRDRLGQETRDANDGRHHRVRTAAFGDVLLVVGDDSFPEEREVSYIRALDGGSWTWSSWHVESDGLPPLPLLQAHRAVIWQVGLEQYPPFNATERARVKAYLDGGGRLLVSSHDTAWALQDPASEFFDPDGFAWVEGVLKASYDCDPTTIGRVVGTAADPIAGAYTGGLPYVPHRDGGAADEIAASGVSGTTANAWTDGNVAGCTPGNRPVGIRWIAASANGTAGVGAWGGTPSRLAYFAFELTGVDVIGTDLNPGSAARAAVLDNALRWLVASAPNSLDRDHPDVRVTAPNGGTYAGPVLDVNWTASVTGGTLGGFSLYASPDAGQTWSLLANLTGAARTYPWDLTGVGNGDAYVIRIVARDAGTPTLLGVDESDAPFSIRRAGGDAAGPRIWAGSVRLSPNPPGAAAPVTFVATADDREEGGSPIAAAELFLAPAEPLPSESGTGIPMDAGDAAFDEAVEALAWSGSLAVAPGASCAWVHARDAAGNWGTFSSLCFVVISAGPDVTPPASVRLGSGRLVNVRADVEVVWERAWDDSLYGGTTRYRVVRSTTIGGAQVQVGADVPATGATSYAVIDAGRGAGDAADYFYTIASVDAANNTASGGVLVAKARVAVAAGTNLLGMPVAAADASIADVGAGLAWSDVWAYDACAAGPPWRVAIPSEGATFALGIGQGFWLNASAAGSLLVVGSVPASARVALCGGWNLVGLPGFATGVTVAEVKAATRADAVVGFDANDPYHTRALADSEVLAAGQGVWVRVPADVTWVVAGW